MMKSSKKLTIAITTYNSEKYMQGYSDFLQKWQGPLEIIFIDDNSTDGTQAAILQLVDKFSGVKDIKFLFHKQNFGVSRSVNDALEMASGELFLQNDADDNLIIPTLEHMQDLLELGPYDMVQAGYQSFSEKTNVFVQDFSKLPRNIVLKKILYGDGVAFQPGTRMYKMGSIAKFIPNGKIFDSRQGQNWQFLLPFCLRGNVFYLNESSICVAVHGDSHSRSERTTYESIDRVTSFLDIWRSSLGGISNSELKIMKSVMNSMLLNLAYQEGLKMLALKAVIHSEKTVKNLLKFLVTFFGLRRRKNGK